MEVGVLASYKSIKLIVRIKKNKVNYKMKYNLYFCKVNKHKISYKDTELFSKLIIDYLSENEKLSSFINHFPSLKDFGKQIEEQKKSKTNRNLLIDVLRNQYSNLSVSDKVENNIDLLKSENTFTITTGHQLCLFTGPLYFIYKIISTINLTEQLKKEYPENNFVPIFWMASEDHDFEEVNHINLFSKKYQWNSDENGMVGDFDTSEISKIISEISSILGDTENANSMIDLFRSCYKDNSLSDATRLLVNELFGKYGIVILDANDKELKKQLLPIIKRDVLHQELSPIISENTSSFSENYKPQAIIRNINFFKLSEGKRERIQEVILKEEIENNPEIFSPNVLMRPLYQELILPNLAYIGGGAEVAYWMQLKSVFKELNIVFPMLVLRNSVMWVEEKDYTKWNNLGFKIEDIFLSENKLQNKFAETKSSVSLEKEKLQIEKIYQEITHKTQDIGMKSSIDSELTKQLNSIKKIERKLLKSEKQKHKISLNQISKIKQKLFPNNFLQERFENIIPFYFKYGEKFIETLKEEIDPLDTNFLILSPQKNKQ